MAKTDDCGFKKPKLKFCLMYAVDFQYKRSAKGEVVQALRYRKRWGVVCQHAKSYSTQYMTFAGGQLNRDESSQWRPTKKEALKAFLQRNGDDLKYAQGRVKHMLETMKLAKRAR